MNGDLRERANVYLDRHPEATGAELLGALMLDPDDDENRELVAEVIGESVRDTDEHVQETFIMADGGRERCSILGCENPPAAGEDYCEECASISPGLVGNPERADEAVNPAGRTIDSPDSPNERGAEPGSGDENPTFETGKPASVAVPDGLEVIHEDGRVTARQPIDPETGVRTDPEEFLRFDALLRENAPEGYVPFYLPVEAGAKGPDLRYGAWATTDTRLSTDEAVRRLENGANVGIAGIGSDKDAPEDALADLDIDDPSLVPDAERKPSLAAGSRSRIGEHGFYFEGGGSELPNIDCSAGELRTDTQYVVAPGSHVPVVLSDPDEPNLRDVPEDERANIGRYTVENEQPATTLEYDDLPSVYREAHEERQRIENERPDRREEPPEPKPSADDRTAIFDLDIRDVTGMSWGERGTNGLGNHNHDHERSSYFVLLKDRGVAYDHKANVAFTAASYGLAAAGARDPDTPNGGLTDEEYLIYWKWCKREGLVATDDPIPTRALRHVALSHGLCEPNDIGDGWKLPIDAYNAALDAVRDEHGLDTGRDRLGGSSGSASAEPVSTLPLAQLDALDPDERRRAARRRGLSWPTTDDLRERVRDRLLDAVATEEDTVLPVPTAGGKSFTTATIEWLDLPDVTDGAPVVQLSETREARDQAHRYTRGADRRAGKLLGRHEACPVAAGDHDPLTDVEREEGREPPEQVLTVDGRPASVVIDELCEDRNVAFSAAHQYVAEHNDQGAPMPCCPPADGDGARYECISIRQWNNVPRNDDGEPTHDVVHATHPFAHVPGLTRGSVVVFDEQPDFGVELGQERIRRMIAALLDELGAPVTTFEAFVSLARMGYGGGRSDAGRERDELVTRVFDHEPPREWYFNDPDAHTLAPAIARALWYALSDEDGPDANGRRRGKVPHQPPRLDAHAHDEEGWNREWVSVVVDEGNTIRRVRAAPDLTGAKCVIGLDARPTPSLWQLNTKPGTTIDALLDADERRLWRRFERGLCVVQVGDAVRPAGKKGKYAKRDPGREVFIEHLREQYGPEFSTAITDSYSENDLRETMREAGVGDPGTMHFGEEKSRNDFGGEAVGAVLGCIDAGDDYVLDTLAELGLDAEPKTNLCQKCEGEGCPDDPNCEDGRRRSRGREFVGPDADTAGALVASVRENHVAQGAGRYARDADDPEDTAVVFVRTSATPAGHADYQMDGVERVAGEKQRAVTEMAREHPGATARELKALTDAELPGEETVSKKHVAETLADLYERGVVDRTRGAGEFGGDTWDASSATDADASGEADLTPEAITNSPVWGTSTWEVAIHDRHAPSPREQSPTGWGILTPEVIDGGDRPPDPPG